MTVIPDSIEPIEEWRAWRFDGTALLSLNAGNKWTAGESMQATCANAERKEWSMVRGGGMSREAASEYASTYNDHQRQMSQMSYGIYGHGYSPTPYVIPTPLVETPDGYGYTLEAVTHAAPHAHCSCGIYAVNAPDACPSGDVFGKVKLWGTIIPGSRGSRAEYAYPSELHVPARLADDPALLAYGVPIVTVAETDLEQFAFSTSHSKSHRMSPWLRCAIAFNIAAGLFNLGALALREWIA